MEEDLQSMGDAPTIDFSLLRNDSCTRTVVVKKIHEACKKYGVFNVTNHGISNSMIEDALDVNFKFFEMPIEAKGEILSEDIFKEVRYGKMEVEGFSRDFLKLYAHPIEQYVSLWPKVPSNYREKMGIYSEEIRKISLDLSDAIMESLHLDHQTHNLLKQNFDQGLQILGVNYYHPLPDQSRFKNGAPPHTDHSIFTILLENTPGLQIFHNGLWRYISRVKGSFQVLVGNHLEVMSNGLYKSVLHRAIPRSCRVNDDGNGNRLSLASFHSFGMDEIVETLEELVNGDDMKRYERSSLRDYLKHLASGDKKPFLDKIRIG